MEMPTSQVTCHSVDLEHLGGYNPRGGQGLAIEATAARRRTAPMVTDLGKVSGPGHRLEGETIIGSAPVRRRMFFLVVHGVLLEEPSTILKITQERYKKFDERPLLTRLRHFAIFFC